MIDFIQIAQRGFEAWTAKPHNKRWFRKIDHTPIPNDLVVNIAEQFRQELAALQPDEDQAQDRWRPIESAPRDGTRIIAAAFGRYGFIESAWWQPEFDAWITSCRQMVMAPGYTIDGETSKLHSPIIVKPTHWIPCPPPPGADQ